MLEKTEREKRHGLLINISGNGKGKTTGALGTCLRALGWGWTVSVLQFVKNAGKTGEKQFADNTELHFEIIPLGAGFTWRENTDQNGHQACAAAAWELAKKYIERAETDLLVLDELNIVLKKGWLDSAEVIRVLKQRPVWMHIIVTGRGVLPELAEASDLVSEIREIKHPYKRGIKAQKGIEF
ncbi:MAG: cob(I)yrinic acid a,c-diamide adenosyltransferase [Victivallaceae bacterium]|nr:cob(I)yrinic acid a,c-diamide adenosyltransferase [Victivallaceae bacterium]